ncbi:hypothetical protein HUU05_24300 [candidate division KSB1 bacterium]|nr:hypothetical protein [candidate division KSB1 bacterium]
MKKSRSQNPFGWQHCAWCGARIAADTEVFGCGARTIPGIDLSAKEGEILPLYLALSRRTVPALVVPQDSQAKREGNDLYFLICSESCGRALKEALEEDKEAFGIISLN